MLKNDDSLPNALYTISVAEVTAKGIDVAGFLQKQNIAAKSILLKKPVIQIINTGVDKPKPYTFNDTLELYKRILGQFKSIRADTINVIDGTILIMNREGKALTTLENIDISLNNFLVDSTRNYQNIISYFIKDVKATVENIQLPESANGTRINISKLIYDAPEKIVQVNSIQQYKSGNTTPIADLKNVQVSQLNTDEFILHQHLIAGKISCDGGLVTIYKKKIKKTTGEEALELSNDLIDRTQIGNIQLNNTQIIIIDPAKPKETPFLINDVKFSTSNIVSVSYGSTVNDLINNAEWELSAGGFSFTTKDKLYRSSAAGLLVNNKMGIISIKQILLKPLFSEAQFVSISKMQRDRYDLMFNDIVLKGVNFKKLISANIIEIESIALQPVIKIFNDRTLPFDTASLVGNYPNQALLKSPLAFYVKKIIVNNGSVFYKEKSSESKMTGTPYFTNINAVISNVTNIPSKIKQDNLLHLKAQTLFLGTSPLNTEWLLPLSLQSSMCTIRGNLGQMNAKILNQITEPLAMASVKKGEINKLTFDFKCNDSESEGTTTFLYNDLTIEVLKKDNDELKKKGLVSFLANALIRNDNPVNNTTYTGQIDFKREIDKSFFNLLWKSIFDGVKKTVLRK